MGIDAYKDLSSVPEEIDLAIIATPAIMVPDILEDCAKTSIQGVIIVSSGFKETGDAAEPRMLSCGTEDYFLGTYYFNRGLYHLPLAGLTHKEEPKNGPSRFSAYRFHDEDPVIFQNGFRLAWRNGEEKNGRPNAPPHKSQVTSYVWLYEW